MVDKLRDKLKSFQTFYNSFYDCEVTAGAASAAAEALVIDATETVGSRQDTNAAKVIFLHHCQAGFYHSSKLMI